ADKEAGEGRKRGETGFVPIGMDNYLITEEGKKVTLNNTGTRDLILGRSKKFWDEEMMKANGMDIGNMPGIVEYTRKKNEKRRNMLTKRFCKNEPNCVVIKQNLQNKEQKKYKALKKAVGSEECVRCERKFRDIRSHAPRCE